MKVFVWDGPTVLKNWGYGLAFAIAETEEEARTMLMAKLDAEYEEWYGPRLTDPDDDCWPGPDPGISGPADHVHEVTDKVGYYLRGSQ